MKALVERYMEWRQKTFPASKHDINWRHEQILHTTTQVAEKLNWLIHAIEMRQGSPINGQSSSLPGTTRYTGAEIAKAVAENRLVIYDYPVNLPSPSYKNANGINYLRKLFGQYEDIFGEELEKIIRYKEDLSSISVHGTPSGIEPYYINGWLPGLDSMYLYTLVRTRQPKTYLEIGSGNSTKFVRKAIKDGNLSTRIVSIDPFPRAEVDQICDRIIREPFETVDESRYLNLLSAGDIVFVDNSHVSYQGSDVTKFFTDTISALPKGVIYGIHDIFLPNDYPSDWNLRFYNEQYLLVAYLLGGGGGDKVLFPGMYVFGTVKFEETIKEIFSSPALSDVDRHAGAFWLERAL